jgi:hypothetical protein
MPDVLQLQSQVNDISDLYGSLATAVQARALALKQSNVLTDQDFQLFEKSHDSLVAASADIIASFDDTLADTLAGAIGTVQAQTAKLKDAQKVIDTVTKVVTVTASLVVSATALTAFVAAPSVASAGAAAAAVADSVGKIISPGEGG